MQLTTGNCLDVADDMYCNGWHQTVSFEISTVTGVSLADMPLAGTETVSCWEKRFSAPQGNIVF